MKVVAAAVILKDDGYGGKEVLLAKRAPVGDPKRDSLWEFPGGKKEELETLFGCVRREVWEELRMLVIVLGRSRLSELILAILRSGR